MGDTRGDRKIAGLIGNQAFNSVQSSGDKAGTWQTCLKEDGTSMSPSSAQILVALHYND